jgi:uncharacterized protein
MLHGCPEIAPGKPRYSSAARDELVYFLTQYQDAIETPITVVFDGANAPAGTPKMLSTPEMEILFSESGKTADELIERVTHRLKEYGEVLVVTDDHAEKDTVTALGGMTSGCEQFFLSIKAELTNLARDVRLYNRRELIRFKKPAS